jgi:hypothetical protein
MSVQDEVPVEQTDESRAEEQKAFQAVFDPTSADAAPVEKTDEAVEPETETAQEEAHPEDVPAVEPEPEIAGLPQSKVKELLANAARVEQLQAELVSTRDRLYGKLGEVQRLVNDVKQPKGGVQLTAATLKRVQSQYPELAELLAQDLAEAATAPAVSAETTHPQQPAFDQAAMFSEYENKVQQMVEKRILAAAHPDWQQVVQTPDFQLWKQGLPVQIRQELDNTWDSSFLIGAFDEFKNAMTQQQQRPPTAPTKPRSTKRLEAAVQPAGVPATDTSENDAYAAFSKVFAERDKHRL